MIEPFEWRCRCSPTPLLWRRRTRAQSAKLAGGDLNSPRALRLQSDEAADSQRAEERRAKGAAEEGRAQRRQMRRPMRMRAGPLRVSVLLSLDLAAVCVIRVAANRIESSRFGCLIGLRPAPSISRHNPPAPSRSRGRSQSVSGASKRLIARS